MRRIIYIFILLVIVATTVFAESLKNLPMPTGTYQVGIAKYDLTDPSRKEPGHPQGRLIPIQIYFPTKNGPHTLHPKVFEQRSPDKWPPLDIEVYSQKADLS